MAGGTSFASWRWTGRIPLWVILAGAIAARMALGPIIGDDAYITFRYAGNLAALEGFVYNAGERVLGTTTPLYTLLLAGASALGIPLAPFAFLFALGSDVAAILLLARALRLAGFPGAGLMAAALVATTPLGLTFAVSGMETSLYTLLILAALASLAKAAEGAPAVPGGAWLGAVMWCRPDGAILACATGAMALWTRRPGACRATAIAVLVVAPWLLFATVYFGSPVPQSVSAKAALLTSKASSLAIILGHFTHGVYVVLTPLALAGAVILWRTGLFFWKAALVWWIAYVAAFTWANAFTHAFWYLVPAMPIYFACAAAATDAIGRRLKLPLAVPIAAAILAVNGWSLPAHRALLLDVQRYREAVYLRAGRDIASSARPCSVAATEIGAVGYAFPGRIIDLGGLVTPAAVHQSPEELLQSERAVWLVVQNVHMPPELASSPWFQREFRLYRSEATLPGRTSEIWVREGGTCGEAASQPFDPVASGTARAGRAGLYGLPFRRATPTQASSGFR